MALTSEQIAAAAAEAPTIHLHRRALWLARGEWVHGLVRTYRESFVERNGRYYRVSRPNMQALWDVEEITAGGKWIAWVTVSARNLPAARLAIALHAAGVDDDTLSDMVNRAPGAPTGQTHRRIRDKERARARGEVSYR